MTVKPHLREGLLPVIKGEDHVPNKNSNVIFILRYIFYVDFKCHLHNLELPYYAVIIIHVIIQKYRI